MEGKVLPAPAVAGILKSRFVEVRLHCDLGPHAQANKALQLELTDSFALPIFVVMDPGTQDVLGIRSGVSFADDFADFLLSSK